MWIPFCHYELLGQFMHEHFINAMDGRMEWETLRSTVATEASNVLKRTRRCALLPVFNTLCYCIKRGYRKDISLSP